MKKKLLCFIMLFVVCIALVIPKTNALTITEAYEQSGGGGYFGVAIPYSKTLRISSQDDVNLDSYEYVFYVDNENYFYVNEDATYNNVENTDDFEYVPTCIKSLSYDGDSMFENFDLYLLTSETDRNVLTYQINTIVNPSDLEDILLAFNFTINSPNNDFYYDGWYELSLYGKPTLNYDGDSYLEFFNQDVHLVSNTLNERMFFNLNNYFDSITELISYYGIDSIMVSLDVYLEIEFDLYFSEPSLFRVYLEHPGYERAEPYSISNDLYLSLFGGNIVEEVINPDFGSWLTSSLSGFMNFEIVDGWSFGIIFALIVAIPIVLYFLKYFFGG